MRVLRGVPAAPEGPIALTIGNFDGVHIGHRAMLRRLKQTAEARKLPACVMIFEPQPREFFFPHDAAPRLSSLREKLELLRPCGVDRVYVCRFDRAFSTLGADAFVHQLLHASLDTRWLLVGEDFRFGARRSGDVALLTGIASSLDIAVSVMESVSWGGMRVSSTVVREALERGGLEQAEGLLGRPYSMSGRVIHGEKLGRALGFPTANVQLKRRRAPLAGIFAVRLHGVGTHALSGVASLGTRPTVSDDGKATLEVHLFDFEGQIYGLHVSVEFLHKLRDEQRYADLETLARQIQADADNARAYFSSTAQAD